MIDLLCVDWTEHKRERTWCCCCCQRIKTSYLYPYLVVWEFSLILIPPPTAERGREAIFPFIFFVCVWEIHHLIFFIVSPSTCSNDDMHQLFTFFFPPFVVSCPAITLQYIETAEAAASIIYRCTVCAVELQLFYSLAHIIVIQHLKKKEEKQTTNGLMKLGYRKWPALLLV